MREKQIKEFLILRDCNMYRYLFICLLVPSIDTASLHQVVEGTEGGSVILPCSHRRIIIDEKPLTVHWRHNDSRNVYDIIHGDESVKEQHPAYNRRAHVSHEHLKKGHVVLKLTNLQLSDRGIYLCFVPVFGVDHITQLVVKERPLPEYTADRIISRGTGTRLGRTLHIIILISGLILHYP